MGNKDDSPANKVVETVDAKKFAAQINVSLFETSAKENKNVEEVMHCFFNIAVKCDQTLQSVVIVMLLKV